MVIERTDALWRCCCEQGSRTGPGIHLWAQGRAARWSKFSTPKKTQLSLTLHLTLKLSPKGLGSKYCEHSAPAFFPPWSPVLCVPKQRSALAGSGPTSLWDSESISSSLPLNLQVKRLFLLRSLSKPSWRHLHKACTWCWERGRDLPEEMQDYFFIEWSAPPGQGWGVFCSQPLISGIEPSTQEALTRDADEWMGGYAQRVCSFKGTHIFFFLF